MQRSGQRESEVSQRRSIPTRIKLVEGAGAAASERAGRVGRGVGRTLRIISIK